MNPARPARGTGLAPALLLTAVLFTGWLVWYPPSPDLAGQVYRAQLFSSAGFAIWDNGWYAGHYLLGYSLLFPPLGDLLGIRLTGIVAVALSTVIFRRLTMIANRMRTGPATLVFALGATGDLFIGRVTFALGVTLGLASVLAGVRGHRLFSGVLSLACAAASPVAAAFLVMVACADLSINRAAGRAAALAGPALILALTLLLLFPGGGYEPFGLSSLMAAVGATGAVLILLPPSERLLRRLAGFYLASLLLAYVLRTPMGSNAVRFGVLFAPPALAGRVRVADVQRVLSRARTFVERRRAAGRVDLGISRGFATVLLGLLVAATVLWQVDGPIDQSVGAAGDPSAKASFYAPAIGYLDRQNRGQPMRVEVAFTRSHWDATVVGRRFLLARGWERQLDTRYDALFYAPVLTARAYDSWLLDNAVRYVALSSAPPDFSSTQEDALIRAGLPFLRLAFATPDGDWRIYRVVGARPLATGPGRLSAVDANGFSLTASEAGPFVVRLHYTRFWTVTTGLAKVSPTPDGWTRVDAGRAGQIAIAARLPGDLDL
ncbi:MAG: hypothetical protein QOH12_3662 [Solirubrobacteraceae bacterium]|jgi:hypothetical protein|nr:hypothetical protein [Solirubrobacteraceae bacterium]